MRNSDVNLGSCRWGKVGACFWFGVWKFQADVLAGWQNSVDPATAPPSGGELTWPWTCFKEGEVNFSQAVTLQDPQAGKWALRYLAAEMERTMLLAALRRTSVSSVGEDGPSCLVKGLENDAEGIELMEGEVLRCRVPWYVKPVLPQRCRPCYAKDLERRR